MKFIKRIFEDKELDPAFGEGIIPFVQGVQLNYLPHDQLQLAIDEFEDLLMLVYLFIDNGISVRFQIAYGQRVFMSYEDYQSKNNKWIEFINAYPKARSITISLNLDKLDIILMSNIIGMEYDDFLKKVVLYKKWKHEHTNISIRQGNPILYDVPMRIEIELKRI